MPDTNGASTESISNNVDTFTTTNRASFASTFVTLSSQNNNLLTQDVSTVRESLEISNNDQESSDNKSTIVIIIAVVIAVVLVVFITVYVFCFKRNSDVDDLNEVRREIGMVSRESELGMYQSPLMQEENDEDDKEQSSSNEKRRDSGETGIVYAGF